MWSRLRETALSYVKESKYGFKEVAKLLSELKGREVLVLSHMDLDGVSSAAIFKVVMSSMGVKRCLFKFRPFVTKVEEVESWLKSYGNFDFLVILDKGTLKEHLNYSHLFKRVIVIDHHIPQDVNGYEEENVTFLNPCIEREIKTSNTVLCRLISSIFNLDDVYLDFFTLLGMRCDYVFDPFDKEGDEFNKPLIELAKKEFAHMFKRLEVGEGEVTRYDRHGGNYTCLFNQVSEALGAFCYADNYIEVAGREGDPVGSTLLFNALLEARERSFPIQKEWGSASEFIAAFPYGELIRKVYRRYRAELKKAISQVREFKQVGKLGKVTLYLVETVNMPLATVAASMLLPRLKRIRKDVECAVLVLRAFQEQVNISFRSTGETINGGLFMRELANKIKEKLHVETSGGGHRTAAECQVFKGKEVLNEVKKVLTEVLRKLTAFYAMYMGGARDEEIVNTLKRYGLID